MSNRNRPNVQIPRRAAGRSSDGSPNCATEDKAGSYSYESLSPINFASKMGMGFIGVGRHPHALGDTSHYFDTIIMLERDSEMKLVNGRKPTSFALSNTPGFRIKR